MAVALGPRVRDLLGLRCARGVEGPPTGGRVALRGEVCVEVDDVQVLKHRWSRPYRTDANQAGPLLR
jgi:hypothetical protein